MAGFPRRAVCGRHAFPNSLFDHLTPRYLRDARTAWRTSVHRLAVYNIMRNFRRIGICMPYHSGLRASQIFFPQTCIRTSSRLNLIMIVYGLDLHICLANGLASEQLLTTHFTLYIYTLKLFLFMFTTKPYTNTTHGLLETTENSRKFLVSFCFQETWKKLNLPWMSFRGRLQWCSPALPTLLAIQTALVSLLLLSFRNTLGVQKIAPLRK